MHVKHVSSPAPLVALLSALLLSTSACGSSEGDEALPLPDRSSETLLANASGAAPKYGNTAGTDGADDRPIRTTKESDRLSLQMAEGACKANDFKSFLRAFSRSWLVQERYTAPRVNYGLVGASRAMPKEQYLDQNNFPFAPIDNDYVTAETVRLFDSDPEADWRKLRFVQVEFNTASDNWQRVDWVSGIFQRNLNPPPPDLEEGIGELVQPDVSGYVLFEPTESCWQLTQDISNPPEQN